MSVERFKSTSPEQLAQDLTKFLYARDYSFAKGVTDVSEHTVKREARTYVDDDGDDVLAPSVTDRFTISSSRNVFLQNWQKAMPSDFVISHRRISSIEEVPPQLRHVLDAELVEQYDNTEPGDLNEVHGVDYMIMIDPEDGLVSIGRDINYKLRDLKEVIYKASEMKLPKTKKVHVPTEDDVIKMRLDDLPETIDDPGLQALVGVDFCLLTMDSITDFEQNWLDVEIFEQVACVNALMNSMITGRPLKQVA